MKRFLVFLAALALLVVSASAQLLMTGAGQSSNGVPFGSQLISQNDYTAGSLASGDSDTRSTTATYFNSSGVLTTASANTARFDYQYNGSAWVARGWSVEISATNTILQSNTLSNATAWNNNTAASFAQNVTGIDGTTSGWTLTSTATGGSSQVGQTRGMTAQCAYAYVAAGTDVWGYIQINAGSGANLSYFNLSTGTVGTTNQTLGGASGTSITTSIMTSQNGYYKIVECFTSILLTYEFIGFGDANSSRSVTSGKTALFSGMQVETTSYPTSYIPTTTTAVIRAADVAANLNWYNGSSGNYLMVESESESSPGTISRASYCNSGCTGTSFSAPTGVWIRRICQYYANSLGASQVVTQAGLANGTACS